MKLTTFGSVDPKTREQIETCAYVGGAPYAVLCADNHLGYSQPIGGVVAYPEMISPSGVGYDIGCGNDAVRTNLLRSHLKKDISKIMEEIFSQISFGMGRKNQEPVDHPVLEDIRQANSPHIRGLLQKASGQLGTVGAGNHYVDLFEDEEGYVWIGVHFGSRGFGHTIASGFLSMAQGLGFHDKAKEGEPMSPPVLFFEKSFLGESYLEGMRLAGLYAHAGREVVIDKVLSILGARATYRVANHHNYAWNEVHFGEKYWVIRKGATPAFPGQLGFVGGSMGDISVILEGVDSEKSREALYSTVHGAGRAMSRTEAAGKVKTTNYRACMAEDCDYKIVAREYQDGHTVCPDHPKASFRKFYEERVIKTGKIDWEETLRDLDSKNIVLKGGAADEAPGAYKRIEEVLAAHEGTIKINHVLRPIGVAMAGRGTFDAYKD